MLGEREEDGWVVYINSNWGKAGKMNVKRVMTGMSIYMFNSEP